jgi:hypothetical protein
MKNIPKNISLFKKKTKMPIFEEALKYVHDFGDKNGYLMGLQVIDQEFVNCTILLNNMNIYTFKSNLSDLVYFMQGEDDNEFVKMLICFKPINCGEEHPLEMFRLELQKKVKEVFRFYSSLIGENYEY